jgi:predicted 3-demethylubiquinone-9 3-methyltransferase (glyoxalase superfamily)
VVEPNFSVVEANFSAVEAGFSVVEPVETDDFPVPRGSALSYPLTEEDVMRPIIPNLWFDTQAEEAARFYVGLFDDSRIVSVVPYGPDTPGPEGSTMVVEFDLMGQRYVGINGGPQFPFTEAVSLEVRCEDQSEIDRIWAALVEGGEPGPCGWLKDRYGLSWQVSSTELEAMLTDPDQEKVNRVTQAFLQVDGEPFDIAALRAAFEGSAESAMAPR